MDSTICKIAAEASHYFVCSSKSSLIASIFDLSIAIWVDSEQRSPTLYATGLR